MALLLIILTGFLLFPTSIQHVPPSLQYRVQSRAPVVSSPETDLLAPFPFPEAIQPQVEFWKTIFTQYTTDQAVIHDSWYVNVIYETIDVRDPKFASKQEGWKAVQAAQKKYEQILTVLSKKWDMPKHLTREEQRVYELLQAVPESSWYKKKDAKDRIRVQVGQADRFKEGLIRAGGYLEAMKQIMAEYQLPESLVYLPLIESAFNPFAESYVGAAGMWQFMRSTGKQYHLTINAQIDERKDPLRATRAAAQLLAYNYKATQSWPMAITAYNHGLQGIINAAKKVKSEEIDVIIEQYSGPAFGFASRNFYPEFLAAVDVCLRHPEYFGELEFHKPLTLTQVTLPDYVSAQTLEKYTRLTVTDLKKLNPALHSSVFTSGSYLPKNYALNIEQDQKDQFLTAYASIPSGLKYQQIAVKAQQHKVKKGETLSTIASRYHISMTALMKANNLKSSSKIVAGRTLKIPGGTVATAQSSASKQETSATTTSAATATTAATTKTASTAPATTASATISAGHRVQKGQTLLTIAKQYNTSVEQLARANQIKDTSAIREGQVLKIPTPTAAAVETKSQPSVGKNTSAQKTKQTSPTTAPKDALSSSTTVAAKTSQEGTKPSSKAVKHRVEKGQTLVAIAKQYNTTVQAITSLNKIKNPRAIQPGQILKIPAG